MTTKTSNKHQDTVEGLRQLVTVLASLTSDYAQRLDDFSYLEGTADRLNLDNLKAAGDQAGVDYYHALHDHDGPARLLAKYKDQVRKRVDGLKL